MTAPSFPSYTAQLLLFAKKIKNLFEIEATLDLLAATTHHYGGAVANAAV